MRRILFFLIGTAFGLQNGYAQCNPFFNLQKDARWEMTSYNGRDKVVGRQVSEVKALDRSSSGWIALVHVKSFDQKDKPVFDKEVELQCENGIIQMDMGRFMPEETVKSLKDMDMTVEVDNLEWPANLSEGTQLDDGSINISGGFMNMTINITDRKVGGKNKITTPAGTFDAFKVTYKISSKMMMNMESTGVDYIADKVGVVRTEIYDKNGKLSGYTVLTRYEEN